jgi:hypothetical protein
MSTAATSNTLQTTERFYTMVKSLDEFDKKEIRGVVDTLLSTSGRERCFIATYYRAGCNVASLLELKHSKHFQAIAMLARNLFELAVDVKLINVIPDGPTKIKEFTDVEKLRCSRKILEFKKANADAKVETTAYSSFVAKNASRIDAGRTILWPKGNPSHWSGLRIGERVALLSPPFGEIYAVNYPQLSWYVHSGLTGVVNLEAETFTVLCGLAFKLAADAYWELLLTMIREFRIAKADEKIEGKLKAAQVMPFTDSPEEADRVLRHLTR